MRLALAVLFCAWFLPGSTQAHQKSVSYSKWTLVEDGAIAQARVRWLELTSLPDMAAPDAPFDRSRVLSYLQDRLVLESAAGPCDAAPASDVWLPTEEGWLRVEWRVRCAGEPTVLQSRLFTSLTNHVHLATVLGERAIDVVLSPAGPRASVTSRDGEGSPPTVAGYIRLGVEHILTGWDHLAFLLLLVVVARRVRDVAVLVTGFTVGHSITLAAAALGLVVPHARAVEATIAASILVVAMENTGMERIRGGPLVILGALVLFAVSATFGELPAFWGIAVFTACYFALLRTLSSGHRLRWVVACLFGFVHGLGFSGVLLEQALPPGQLLRALFGFNVGVELGQLGIVALVWPLLRWATKRGFEDPVVDATAVAGAAIGTFALVARVFG